MGRIVLLPEEVASQVAAGEVERVLDMRQRDVDNSDIELHHHKSKTGGDKEPQQRTAQLNFLIIHRPQSASVAGLDVSCIHEMLSSSVPAWDTSPNDEIFIAANN